MSEPIPLTINCDNPECNYSAKTTAPLSISDIGTCCPECGEVILTAQDIAAYKAAALLSEIGVFKNVGQNESPTHRFHSRTGLSRISND